MSDMKRLYYFTQTHWAIENIALKRLKVSYINELNDPYELLGYKTKEPANKEEFKKYVAKKYGVICLSQSCESPVMWAHYADKHKGICLGFDVCEDECVDVFYPKTMVDFLSNSNSLYKEDDLKKILSVKCHEWEYEKETRIFIPITDNLENELIFEYFGDRLMLRELILGYDNKTELTAIKELTEKCYKNDIQIFKTELSITEFKVCKKEIAYRRKSF